MPTPIPSLPLGASWQSYSARDLCPGDSAVWAFQRALRADGYGGLVPAMARRTNREIRDQDVQRLKCLPEIHPPHADPDLHGWEAERGDGAAWPDTSSSVSRASRNSRSSSNHGASPRRRSQGSSGTRSSILRSWGENSARGSPMPSSGLGEQSQQVYGSRRRDGGDGANNARRSAADMQRVEAGHRSATGGFVGPRRTPGERTWVAPSRRDGQTQVENLYYVGAPSQARREETRPASTVPNRITPGSLSRKPATPRI